MRQGYWNLNWESRDVRYPSFLTYAPCGCSDKEQATLCLDIDNDDSLSYVECLGCGASWDTVEGNDWAYYDTY